MSGFFCDRCWFLKISEGAETHNSWRDDLKEGDCIITSERCDHEWEGHSEITACPTLKAFYSQPSASHPKETQWEQMKLF